MIFIIDAQLPPALARWLTQAGHEAYHVEELGLRNAEDNSVWQRALALDAAIVTKDDDFASRVVHGQPTPVIVWLRIGNCSNRALQAWFGPLLPDVMNQIQQGQKLIELRSYPE